MRTLHVAALPYPSPQGTQALLHQMLGALAAEGHDTHLLCYRHGAAEQPGAYVVHRSRARSSTGSLRSGPSIDKLRLDAALARELPKLIERLAPEWVIAHHVEAAALALAARPKKLAFVAHTDLGQELPSYATSGLRSLARWSGARLDRALLRRVPLCFAVSPLLARMLSKQSGVSVHALSTPWPVASRVAPRSAARDALGFAEQHEVLLYAGNLDAYQGISELIPVLSALARSRPQLRILIATESDTTGLALELRAHGLRERVQFSTLADEAARTRLYAAADLALVPRRCPGGVPIKLLDAFARALPVVAARCALAGLPVEDLCTVVERDTVEAWAEALQQALARRAQVRERALAARQYLATQHSPQRFVSSLLEAAEA